MAREDAGGFPGAEPPKHRDQLSRNWTVGMAEQDAALVARCLKGEVEVFGELVRRHERSLYNGALRIVGDPDDAKDIVQAVFVKAYEKLSLYDPDRKFFSWIYRMMVNASLNWIESKERLTTLDPGLTCTNASPEAELLRSEENRQIEDALDRLKPELRLAVVLKYFGELSYAELAYVLDVPAKTVKSRLYEARRALAAIMSQSGVTYEA